MSAIAIRSVTKRFGAVEAVHDLTLTVPEGSIYGFIGPNGSGKTTTIRMIMNILVPDAGEITVFDRRDRSAAREAVGYLPEERGLYKRMTVRQVLQYYGQLKGKPAATLEPAIRGWLERFQLAEWADKKVQALSKGMAQKVQFISAVVAEPRLLILDEPFSGLDPINADALRDAVIGLRRRGTTIVFSTHDMAAAERLCDRIFMIFKGHKVLDGSLDEIQSEYGRNVVRIRTAAGAAALQGLPGVTSIADAGNYPDVTVDGDPLVLLHELIGATAVHQFEIRKPSLHDIFVRIARPTAADLEAEAGAA
jgi:ABC-2 type transport system ATP-binding protein